MVRVMRYLLRSISDLAMVRDEENCRSLRRSDLEQCARRLIKRVFIRKTVQSRYDRIIQVRQISRR